MAISRVYYLATKEDIYPYKMKYTTHPLLISTHLSCGLFKKLELEKELGGYESV